MVAAAVTPGVFVGGLLNAVAVAIVLGILNMIVRPILLVLTLPVNILTLGLFTFVINTFIILLAAKIVPGFIVAGFIPALIFGILLSLINAFMGSLER